MFLCPRRGRWKWDVAMSCGTPLRGCHLFCISYPGLRCACPGLTSTVLFEDDTLGGLKSFVFASSKRTVEISPGQAQRSPGNAIEKILHPRRGVPQQLSYISRVAAPRFGGAFILHSFPRAALRLPWANLHRPLRGRTSYLPFSNPQ